MQKVILIKYAHYEILKKILISYSFNLDNNTNHLHTFKSYINLSEASYYLILVKMIKIFIFNKFDKVSYHNLYDHSN